MLSIGVLYSGIIHLMGRAVPMSFSYNTDPFRLYTMEIITNGIHAGFERDNVDMKTVEEKVAKLFIAVDSRDWAAAGGCLAEQVLLDYSSMSGEPPALLKAGDIIDAWKTVLPGFQATHHQLGNVLSSAAQSEASLFCYGTATHYLELPSLAAERAKA